MKDTPTQPPAPLSAACLDCGLPYEQFQIDLLLPRSQWLEIHPDESGLLCARCIALRAAKLPGATAVRAVIEIAPRHLRQADLDAHDEQVMLDALYRRTLGTTDLEEWIERLHERLTQVRARVAALDAELAQARATLQKREERLEITTRWIVKSGSPLLEVLVPPNERDSMPDAVTCRDASLALEREENENLRAELAQARQERDALEADILALKELHAVPEKMQARFAGIGVKNFALMVAEMFRETGATNFVEVGVEDDYGERYILTFQKARGLTPNQKCQRAERERDAALKERDELKLALAQAAAPAQEPTT